jgi:hypothetical protein
VPMSSVRSSPSRSPGVVPERRVSISARSRTTSQSRLASAALQSRRWRIRRPGSAPTRDVALRRALEHPDHHRIDGVVRVDGRQVAEAEVVLGRRAARPPRLQAATSCRRRASPTRRSSGRSARRTRRATPPTPDAGIGCSSGGCRRASGRPSSPGCSRGRGGEDAAAGTADVAEQELHDRRRPDGLDAGRVLRPADGVADGGRPLAAGAVAQRLRDGEERSRGTPQISSPPPACSARSAAQQLVDAARVLTSRRRRAGGSPRSSFIPCAPWPGCPTRRRSARACRPSAHETPS